MWRGVKGGSVFITGDTQTHCLIYLGDFLQINSKILTSAGRRTSSQVWEGQSLSASSYYKDIKYKHCQVSQASTAGHAHLKWNTLKWSLSGNRLLPTCFIGGIVLASLPWLHNSNKVAHTQSKIIWVFMMSGVSWSRAWFWCKWVLCLHSDEFCKLL